VNRITRRLAVLIASVAALAAATTGSASASACGVALINDWYDGQISKVYPLHCYQDALKLLDKRADIDIYSNARQDILLALQAAISSGKGGGGGPPDGFLRSLETADALPSFLGGPDSKHDGRAPNGTQPYTIKTSPASSSGPLGDAFNAGQSSASSVPLPAIVLGGVAVFLLALGGAAFLARRRQTRRETFRPQTDPGSPKS
jgi:hypothetical protein